MKKYDLTVPLDVFNEIIRYKQEILILMNEITLNTQDKAIKDALRHISESELYYLLEYHQKVFINYLHFKEESILENYLHWFYRVYLNKDLYLDFFSSIYKLWVMAYSRYLDKTMLIPIKKFYEFLDVNNEEISKTAMELKTFYIDTKSDELYNFLVTAQKDKFREELLKNTSTQEDFLHFFSTHVVKAMQKVGFMWEIGEISVAKEHISSSILEEICFEVINTFPKQESNNKSVLLVNAPNEFHGLGLKFISKLLENMGYKVISLGSTGTPKKDILKAVEEFEPSYLVIGVSISINLYEVALIIKEVNKLNNQNSSNIEILLGGNACNDLNNPRDLLKAHEYFKSVEDIVKYFD